MSLKKVGGDRDWRRLRREIAEEGNIGPVKEKDGKEGGHLGESKRY